MSNELGDNTALVTLRISRFTPCNKSEDDSNSKQTERKRRESPFARRKRSNPFAKLDSSKNNINNSSESSESRISSESGEPYKSSPKRIQGKHWVQDYSLRVHSTDTILDCLLTIKRTIDPTLAFRYSCGHGVCGSDAANVNGMPTLLCSATIGANARPESTNSVQSRALEKLALLAAPHSRQNRQLYSKNLKRLPLCKMALLVLLSLLHFQDLQFSEILFAIFRL